MQVRVVIDCPCGDRPVKPARSHPGAIRHVKRHRFDAFAARIASCTVASWRGVPLRGPSLRGLAGRSGTFPPAHRPAALMGFFGALRRFAPAAGGISFLNCRARVPFAFASPARSVFIGSIPPQGTRETMRARVAAKSGKRGRWLPGFTPVCGPPGRLLFSRQSWRSCHGLCLLQGFGRVVRASGQARPCLDHPGQEVRLPPCPLMGLGGPYGSAPPSLQRIQNPDASPTRATFERCAGKLPV